MSFLKKLLDPLNIFGINNKKAGPNAADLARQAENERQGRITQGTADINKAFGQFDDNYYGGVT